MSVFQDQQRLMELFGQRVGRDLDQASMYMDLVEEESGELSEAFAGVEVAIANGGQPSMDALVDVADGIIDSMVVLCGLGVSLGFPLQVLWDEVLRSNMSKVHPDGTVRRRDDGKVLKPDTFSPPDLAPLIKP